MYETVSDGAKPVPAVPVPAMPRLRGFPPAGEAGLGSLPVFLVLGSFPSEQSLAKGEYYAHPRNHFWRLVASCLREPLPLDYDAKLSLLRRGRVALWDVFRSCERHGSLDKNILKPEANGIEAFIRESGSIKAVGLNGGAAAEGFYRSILGAGDKKNLATRSALLASGGRAVWAPDGDSERSVALFRLPSSSPVPSARYRTIEDKIAAWDCFFHYTDVGQYLPV